jgi:hypothetical protein
MQYLYHTFKCNGRSKMNTFGVTALVCVNIPLVKSGAFRTCCIYTSINLKQILENKQTFHI